MRISRDVSRMLSKFPGGKAGALAVLGAVGGFLAYKHFQIKPGDVVSVELSRIISSLPAGQVPFMVVSASDPNSLGVVYQPQSGGNIPPPQLAAGTIQIPRSSVVGVAKRANFTKFGI